MIEKTLEIEIPLIIPGLADPADGCLRRLEMELQTRKGIHRAHVEGEKSPMSLCLHYDPTRVSIDDVRRLAERAGAGIANRYHHALITLEGMDCSDCATVIEHGVGRMEGVLAVNVSYAAQTMQIEYDAQKTSYRSIEKRLNSLGYAIPAGGLRSWFHENRELLWGLAAGLLLCLGWLGETFFRLPHLAAVGLYVAAYIFGGWDVSRHAWHALKERNFDTDLLMVTAALGAALLGDFAEGALLLFLFSLGHALEERALNHARAAVRALADLTPKTAWVKRDGREIEIPLEQLLLGDVTIVRPGVRVPVDGLILCGHSGVDQSPITGEAVPVDRGPGDKVFAGSINGEGALEVQATKLAKDSTLARVLKMVEEAQAQKSPAQQLTEKFERIFVPSVLAADILLILAPPLWGVPFQVSFLRAMTLLVAASPCALALGSPATILAGIGQAARKGVLIKGGAHLENLGQLKAIAFDKTGTVTQGRPELTDVIPCVGVETQALLAVAMAVESRSAHPLAQTIVRGAQSQDLVLPAVSNVRAVTGLGVQAEIEARPVWIGNARLFKESGIEIPADLLAEVTRLEDSGKTTMLVRQDNQFLGLLAVADVLRVEAAASIAELQRLGVRSTVMLTGDNARVAAAIAHQAGLTDYRADLLPEDKLTAIRELSRTLGEVAMVGDGVNDAPALANATVGIAMGGAGTDVALETADVVLMGDDLEKLPFAVGLGRATRAIIIQNLVISLGVMAWLSLASLAGLAGIGLAVIFHEGSTIAVVLNALRLLGFKEKRG